MTTISNRVFSSQTMAGRNYVSEFPDLLQAVADSSTFEAGHSDAISLPSKLYLQHGELELAASPNKRFFPGMLVTLSGDNNATKGYAFVVRYAASTGVLVLSVQWWSGVVIHGPTLRITVSVNGAIAAHTGPISAAKGGTDNGTLEGLYLNYSFVSPEIFSERITDDFIEYMDSSVPFPYEILFQSTAGTFYSYPKPGAVSSFNPENRAGFLALEVSTNSDVIEIRRGSAHRNILSDTAAVCGAVHVFDFMLPVLSDGTNHYEFRIGLPANDSSPGTLGDYGGIVISYRHDINSGNFRIYYGLGGVVTHSDTSVALTAGAWNRVEISASGDSCTVYINGSLALTLASVDVYSNLIGDIMSPAFSMTKIAGSAVRLAIIDVYSSTPEVVR